MKTLCTLAIVHILVCVVGFSSPLPKVIEGHAPQVLPQGKKRLSEFVHLEDIRSITMIENRGKGGLGRNYDSDALFAELSTQDPYLETSGGVLLDTEMSLALYVIVFKNYSTCSVEVLCDLPHGQTISRIYFKGLEFGGWVRLETKKPNQAPEPTSTAVTPPAGRLRKASPGETQEARQP